MVKYGDYFSRKVLHNCDISPNEILLYKDGTPQPGMHRTENIRLQMMEIYQTLYRGYTGKNSTATKEEFDTFHIKSKIVSAFYDSGTITNSERDYFQKQELQISGERERICVGEADLSAGEVKTGKVDVQINVSLERKI